MKMKIWLQYILPHHLLSELAGKLANSHTPWLKLALIQGFLKRFPLVNLAEAETSDINQYQSFNDFFIRHLKKTARPIHQSPAVIASPADGNIAEIGQITDGKLIQAKGHDFRLSDLLGNEASLIHTFQEGLFATIYLAPHHYHRVHVPFDSKLISTHFIPGKLFSVNQLSANTIPSLYSRNERLICIMENEQLGKFAIILVGAMIVGSIQLIFEEQPVRADSPVSKTLIPPVAFKKGEELGHFKMGSTVILLFEKNTISWNNHLKAGTEVMMGSDIGSIKK